MKSNSNRPWQMHSSQEEAIKDILNAGGTVQLTYVVTEKPDAELINKKMDAQLAGKQRL